MRDLVWLDSLLKVTRNWKGTCTESVISTISFALRFIAKCYKREMLQRTSGMVQSRSSSPLTNSEPSWDFRRRFAVISSPFRAYWRGTHLSAAECSHWFPRPQLLIGRRFWQRGKKNGTDRSTMSTTPTLIQDYRSIGTVLSSSFKWDWWEFSWLTTNGWRRRWRSAKRMIQSKALGK